MIEQLNRDYVNEEAPQHEKKEKVFRNDFFHFISSLDIISSSQI